LWINFFLGKTLYPSICHNNKRIKICLFRWGTYRIRCDVNYIILTLTHHIHKHLGY
jgi:hypothetical protein